jgi:type IV pilus assembly protein PilC
MKKFKYLVKDSAGKVSKGEIDAKDRDGAAESLSKKGLSPIYIKAAADRFDFLEKFNEISTIPVAEKVMFSKQLATLVSAGIPIAQSMHILEEQTDNKRMKKAIVGIGQDIENGTTLSIAISKYPTIFSPLYSNMIKAGEIGGILDQSLEKMADEIDKEHELVASIRGAMYYPMVIIITMVLVVMYMITTIIPQLASVFTQNGSALPASTQFLLNLSYVVGHYGFLILIAFIGLIVGFRMAVKKNYKFRYGWHAFLIKTPVFGKLMKKINISRFTRTLSSLLSAGVTVLEALKISSDVLANEVFKKEIDAAAEKVKNGTQLGEALKASKLFPIIVPQMISVGEETGTLDKILEKLTHFYQNEIDHTVKNLSSLMEPMIMILLGFGVGFIVIAIITPIYSMANTF